MFKDENRHYSLRKLSVGLASVLIGISFVSGNGHTVKADTVKDGSNGAQTVVQTTADDSTAVVKDHDTTAEANAKDNANTAIKANAESTLEEQSQTSEVVKKNSDAITQDSRQNAVKASEAAINVQDNTVKDNGYETTLNAKGSKAIAANMPKEDKTEVKENQDWTDPAKNKLQMSTVRSTTSKRLTAKVLAVSKVMSQANDTNGGFDEATWGKLDVNDWQGSVQDGVYELTDYTGDLSHIIVPNEADFEKAGKSTNGLQVGITRDTIHSLVSKNQQQMTIAFSKTNNQKVKAIGTDWSNAFSSNSTLSKFDGSNLDVSNVTDMTYMFNNSQISDLTSLANWDVSNVTDMSGMFEGNSISDLTPLTNWNTGNVTDMSWMFGVNKISNLTPLTNWNASKVTDMYYMFAANPDLIDLRPIANWNLSNVKDQESDQGRFACLFYGDTKLDLTNINDTSLMKAFLKDPDMLASAIFITNNADLVKATINQDLPNLTNTAKRTIIFNIPNATPKIIVQTINYKAVAPVQVDFDNQQIVKTYPVKESDWQLDTSKQNDDVIIDGVICFKPVKIPHVNGYKAYTVPEIKGLLELDQTVISRQQADINKPINVTVTYKLVDSNTNDAFALDSKNGLHEHANVNDNGGYDTDFWGKINVDDWNYTVNGDTIEINGLKDSVSTGANDAVIVPNLDDFKLAGKDGGAKTVHISTNTLGETAKHKYYGLSKTNGNKFATDSNISNAFYNNSNLTHADLNSLNTGNVTDMEFMFGSASGLTSLDVSNWDTSNVTNMSWMFNGVSSLTSLDVSKWDTSNVTDMSQMFNRVSSLTSLDVSKWDTGNVTNMSHMFYNAPSLTDLDVSNWDTSQVTNMVAMFYGASRLTSLDVSKWNTSKVTDMGYMFYGARSLALIVNGDKFADYLVNHDSFAKSKVDSGVKSVTTDNTKLLKLLTNDVQHNSAIRTVVFTFPANYSPDLAKYHLTKNGNTYQIKQSADYDKPYAQGTVLINATDDITKHHIDTTKPNKLSDTWQPNYDKLVLAHKNADGTVSFDKVQLPKVPGYKAKVTRNNGLLLVNYLVFAPEKPATNNNLNELQFSNKLTTNNTVQFNSAVNSNIVVKSDMYQVVNDDHNWQLPVIKSYDLKFTTNKNQIIFAYTKDKQYNYRFVLTFKGGQYRLTTFDKQGKLLKTYSIESYKKLAEIIHSLVPMNIA